MVNKFTTAFFAFPASPPNLGSSIKTAVETVNAGSTLKVVTWPQMDVFGSSIPEKIKSLIDDVDILFCDITFQNQNVYYEIGYAIGRGVYVAPLLNVSFAGVKKEIQRDGLFDNIGYKEYENSHQLSNIMQIIPSLKLRDLYSKNVNFQQPLFILDTLRKTDFRNAIVSSMKQANVFYRSFDPAETPRLSTVSLIGDVTSSSGIIIPLLAPAIDDAVRHNLRAAFVAGLSHGLERETLLIELETGEFVHPTDYRDKVVTVRNQGDLNKIVMDFAALAHLASQSISAPFKNSRRSELQRLSLGASAAENEFRKLDDYFVSTAEYLRTLRGEVQVVAGRKGSGKTAIFFQSRDYFRKSKNNVIIDLKPESHQLSLFRQEILRISDVGTFDHTLAAFWYFLILSETLLSLKK